MRIIHLDLSHRRMPFSFFVMDLPYDVTFKPPAHPPKKSCILTSTSTVISSHEKIQKVKKKITEPLIDQVVTLLPKGWSFSSLWSVAPNFSPSLFKEQQALSPLVVQRGLSPVGEGHTSHSTYKRPASLERKWKRTKGLHLKGVFSSVTRVLALWER